MKKYLIFLVGKLLILHGTIFAMKEEAMLNDIQENETHPLYLTQKPLQLIDNGIRLPTVWLTPIRLDVVRFVHTHSSEKEDFWNNYLQCYSSYVKKNTTDGLIYKASKEHNDENLKFLLLILQEQFNLDESIERYVNEGIVKWLKEYFTRVAEKKTSYNILHKAIENGDFKSLQRILGEELRNEEKIKCYCSTDEITWIDTKLLDEAAEKRRKSLNRQLIKAQLCQNQCLVCTDHQMHNNKEYSKIFKYLARYEN